ncbi:MAG: sensor histidine kinase [Bacteroidetes bacterium]|nr:MAG: sensor histidine kinase [Bacteroidota bacterium]
MDAKLVPAHVLFAKWFIRIRWIALFTLIISTYVVKNFFKVSIQDIPIYYLSVILFGFNCLHIFILKVILLKELNKVIIRIKWDIHFQIITDLIILTLILHFSGGIENPMIIFFFLHMIIASSIFSTFGSYLHTTFAFVLVAMLAFFEYYSIIPHCHLEGFINPDLYQNKLFIYGSGFIFISTSLLLVHLTHLIVSRSIKIEENYVKTNDELEKKDELKNEYVLRVTHDIKGHLAAILSCLDVIRSKITGPLNDKQEEFVNRAFERTELLTDFVKALLNLTKKRLKQDTEFEQFLLIELIEKVVSSVQILAKDKSIEFTVFIDNNIRTITGDPFTIEELYSNLLLNAIKYTPPKGRIELSVRNRPDHIVTEISDSGIGIPKEEIPKVFDEFYRATNVPKDIRTGSGLGLSIVKQIVENHKGRIWVNSEVGIWTKFTFTLPKNPNLID